MNASLCTGQLLSANTCSISQQDQVAEWLRRWTANPMGSARVSSNLILVESFFSLNLWISTKNFLYFCLKSLQLVVHCCCFSRSNGGNRERKNIMNESERHLTSKFFLFVKLLPIIIIFWNPWIEIQGIVKMFLHFC